MNGSSSAAARSAKHYNEAPPGKEEQELLLLQKFIKVTSLRSFRLTATQIRGHRNASQSTNSRHISTCSEETVWIRPLCLKSCKETSTVDDQQDEDICFLDEWFSPNVRFLVATATSLLDPERWADGFYTCGSHCEAWRWRCDAVGAGWHLVGPSFGFPTWQWPQTHFQAMEELFEQGGEWQGAGSHDPAPTVTSPKPRVKAKHPTSAEHLWEQLQECWRRGLECTSDDSFFLLKSPGLSRSRINLRRKKNRIFKSTMSNACQYASVQMCFWNQWETSCRKHKVEA